MLKSIASYYCENIKYCDSIPAIADVGFEGIMLKWQDNTLGESKYTQLELSNKYNLQIINLHCDYRQCNTLWQAESQYDQHLIDMVNVCADHNIPVAVVHLSSQMTPPPPSQIGLERLRNVVALAEQKNIKLAFENLRLPVFNKYVFENISSPVVGMCFDVGHDHVYCKNYDVVKYLNRPIWTTHLHDNDGTFDQHVTPMLGTNDWDKVIDRLHSYNIKQINLECGNRGSFDFDGKQYIKYAYDVACKLEKMLQSKYDNESKGDNK